MKTEITESEIWDMINKYPKYSVELGDHMYESCICIDDVRDLVGQLLAILKS